jgi:hypothetical protein
MQPSVVGLAMTETNILWLADFLKSQPVKPDGARPTTGEGLALLKAFMRVSDPERRAAIITMVEQEAEHGAAGDPEES